MPPTRKSNRPQAVVTRDETFHRAVADKVVAIDLGRDIEFAFLQVGPIVKRLVDLDEDSEQVELGSNVTEVARIRVTGPVALNIAVNVIETLVSAGKVKTPALLETLKQIAARHADAGATQKDD